MPFVVIRLPRAGGQDLKSRNHKPPSSCFGHYVFPTLHPCGLAGTIPSLQVQVASANGSETGMCPSGLVTAHPGTSRTRGNTPPGLSSFQDMGHMEEESEASMEN